MKRRYDQISNDEPPLQDGEGQYQAKRVHFEDSEKEILRVTDLVDKESGDWVQTLIDILEEQENGDREDKKRAKSQDWRSNKTKDYEITLEPPCPHNTLNGSKNLEECKCPSQKGFHKTALNTSLILLTYSNFKTLLERSVSNSSRSSLRLFQKPSKIPLFGLKRSAPSSNCNPPCLTSFLLSQIYNCLSTLFQTTPKEGCSASISQILLSDSEQPLPQISDYLPTKLVKTLVKTSLTQSASESLHKEASRVFSRRGELKTLICVKNEITKEAISLIKLLSIHRKSCPEKDLDFSSLVVEIFLRGKDERLRLRLGEIVKLALNELKGYFRDFCQLFRNDESQDIRNCALEILIEYSLQVDHSVSLTVFEMVCMYIRSINHDERLFATKCLVKFKNLRRDVIEKMFERQVFAKAKEGVDNKLAVKKAKGRLAYNYEHCTFEEEPYTGIFFALSQDEKYEIRLQSIEALKYFSSKCQSIQDKVKNILMNMLNDEIDEVRIASLQCMSVFNNALILDKNSVNIVVFNLKEHNSELRHSIYSFFGHIQVENWHTFNLLMDHLLLNISKFKMDKLGIYHTFKRLGDNHSEIVYNNLEKILGHNLKFKMEEPHWDDVKHTAKMIMICNSINIKKEILSKVPWYFDKQWSFYSNKYPELVTCFNHEQKNLSLTYLKLKELKIDSGKTLVSKYRLNQYKELRILLHNIWDGSVVRYDFESLFQTSHHYDDPFVEFIPCLAKTLYYFSLKDYLNFLKNFSILLNSFEIDQEHAKKIPLKQSRDVHNLFRNLDNREVCDTIPLSSIATYVIYKMHLSDILKGFPDLSEPLNEENKLEDLDQNKVYIPKLRKISDVNIIKPMNKIARIEVLKEDSPMNFKIVFTIKGLAEACSDTLHSKSNYYVTIQNPNGKLKSCLISQEDINKAKNLRKISEIDNSYYDDPSELKFEK